MNTQQSDNGRVAAASPQISNKSTEVMAWRE